MNSLPRPVYARMVPQTVTLQYATIIALKRRAKDEGTNVSALVRAAIEYCYGTTEVLDEKSGGSNPDHGA